MAEEFKFEFRENGFYDENGYLELSELTEKFEWWLRTTKFEKFEAFKIVKEEQDDTTERK